MERKRGRACERRRAAAQGKRAGDGERDGRPGRRKKGDGWHGKGRGLMGAAVCGDGACVFV